MFCRSEERQNIPQAAIRNVNEEGDKNHKRLQDYGALVGATSRRCPYSFKKNCRPKKLHFHTQIGLD